MTHAASCPRRVVGGGKGQAKTKKEMEIGGLHVVAPKVSPRTESARTRLGSAATDGKDGRGDPSDIHVPDLVEESVIDRTHWRGLSAAPCSAECGWSPQPCVYWSMVIKCMQYIFVFGISRHEFLTRSAN